MPATIRICPTDEERADLEQRFEAIRDAEPRLLCQMALLAAAAKPPRSCDAVSTRCSGCWIASRTKADGIRHRPRPGRAAGRPPPVRRSCVA